MGVTRDNRGEGARKWMTASHRGVAWLLRTLRVRPGWGERGASAPCPEGLSAAKTGG